jgi:hypothetical protein
MAGFAARSAGADARAGCRAAAERSDAAQLRRTDRPRNAETEGAWAFRF